MKIAAWIGSVGTLIAAPAMAVTISFYNPITGVDNPAGWSTDGSVVQLAPSYSLLGGNATVSGSENGVANDLSHTGTRGLGVWDEGAIPVENDEIDNFSGTELIEIAFNGSYRIDSVEVRSLFNSTAQFPNTDYLGRQTPPEKAFIDFYFNSTLIHTEVLTGTEFLGTEDGSASVSYVNGFVVDRLVFRVPTSADLGLPPVAHDDDPYTFTDFAVARLDVTQAVPEPLTASLVLVGAGALGLARRRRKSRN